MVTQYLLNLFVSYAVLIYILYIELVEFCYAINIKGVKWGFRYFGNVKGTPSFELIIF